MQIDRPRLGAKVRASLERGPVLMIAPAGYGKTTVLHHSLAGIDSGLAWVNCTPYARDARHLLSLLIVAIAAAIPGATEDAAARIAAARGAVHPVEATCSLLADLDRLLVDPVTVVIDNAEELEGSAEALAVVAELLSVEAARVRVAVAARRPLDIPLAKLRLTGRVTDVGVGDLVFDAEECARCLASAMGSVPPEDDVRAVVDSTEGWPLAVVAVVHAGTNATRTRPLRTPAELSSFLAEEVLANLEPVTRRHVLESAVPSCVSPRVAGALELPDNFAQLATNSGLYVRPLDEGAAVFAYHPLFREFLLERLRKETDPKRLAELHRRAGRALAAEGHSIEAVEHALEAEDWAAVVTVLDDHGPELATTSPDLVRSWLGRMPDSVRADPAVLIIDGSLEWATGNHGRSVEILRETLETDGDAAREWQVRFMLVDSLILLGRIDDAVALTAGFDQPAAADAGPQAAAAALHAAQALAGFGRADEAAALADAASRLADSRPVAPIDFMRHMYVDVPAGRLERARADALAMHHALRGDDPFVGSRATVALALIAADQGYVEDSLGWWRRMDGELSTTLLPRLVAVARGYQAMLLAQLGRIGEAEVALAGAHPVATWPGYPHHVARAAIDAARGDRTRTIEAAARAMETLQTAFPLYRFWAAADLVPSLVRVGAIEQAENLVGDTATMIDDVFPGAAGRLARARLLALRAWLSAAQGDQDVSDERLLAFFTEAGEVAPYVLRREWPRLELLVSGALERGLVDATSVVRHLASAFPDGLALVPFADHPDPAVRRAALGPALASGHPEAAVKLAELQGDSDATVAAAARALQAGIAVSPPPRVFTVLGGFSVRRGAWRVEESDWQRRTPSRLMRFLITRAGAPVPEDVIFDTFWPDAEPDRARRSLQVAVSRARAVLDHPGAPSVLDVTEGVYRLRLAEADIVDSEEFDAVGRSALVAPADRRLLEHARSLWTGEPLPEDRYADWAAEWRETLIDRYRAVLNALVSVYEAEGDTAAVIGAARELVVLDPVDEGAHRTLIAAYARTGRTGRSLRQYLECRRALAELGIEPTDATSRLQARVVAGEEV